MKSVMETLFTRTSCGCSDDVANCRRQPGPLGVGDLARIAAHLGDGAVGRVVPSKGAVLLVDGERVRVRTMTPARKADGSCTFLDDGGRCSIYPVAPQGCRFFDVHMSPLEGVVRAVVLHREIGMSATYRRERDAIGLRLALPAPTTGGSDAD